jgi:hypothetical protein
MVPSVTARLARCLRQNDSSANVSKTRDCPARAICQMRNSRLTRPSGGAVLR